MFRGITWGTVFVPLITIILAYVIIRKKYKIDEKEYERIVKELN